MPTNSPETFNTIVEAWETWGTAARWNPTHHWHAPDDEDTAA